MIPLIEISCFLNICFRRLSNYRKALAWMVLFPVCLKLAGQQEVLFRAEFYTSNGRLCREQVLGQVGDGHLRNTIFESDSARIAIYLPADIRLARLKTMGRWEILFPPDATFPNMGTHVWKIMLGDKTQGNSEDRILKELNNLKKQGIADKDEMLAKIQASLTATGEGTQAEIRQQMDSLLQLITVFQQESANLEAANREQQKLRRAGTLEMLDSTIQVYLSRVTDYKEELRLRKSALFYDPSVVRFINERISGVNQAYECLNKNSGILIQQIQSDWKSVEVQMLATRLLNELLLEFHNKKVKEQGNHLLRDIDAHLKGAKGARKKNALRTDLQSFISLLETEINRLSQDYEAIRNILNAKD